VAEPQRHSSSGRTLILRPRSNSAWPRRQKAGEFDYRHPSGRSRARRIPEPSCGPNWRTKPSAHAVGFPLANWRSGHSDEKGGRQGEIEDEAALNDQLSRNSLDKIASSLRGVLPYLFCRLLLGAASLPCLGVQSRSEVGWIASEAVWLICPRLTDRFVGR